jgi:hypothetical protein
MRRASLGVANDVQQNLLVKLGFATKRPTNMAVAPWEFTLTDVGRAFDDAVNVYGDHDEAKRLFREAYLRMPVTQALMQGLRGRDSVPVTGALHLLARHGLADAQNVSAFRTLLTTLNSMQVVAYSVKQQTVRLVEPLPDSEDNDDAPQPSIRIVEPDRPYSNIRHLRETIRSCRDYIWWADPHFEKRGFEPLMDEADASRIKSIRILSGTRPSSGDLKDYNAFKTEMAAIGITVEYSVVAPPDREWHDRFIVSRHAAWNVPPLGAVTKGSYSEFTKTATPPFESWWKKGTLVDDL